MIATVRTPIGDAIALEAIRLIGRSLSAAFRDGSDAAARSDMACGSLMAGLTMNIADCTAEHSLGQAIGGMFHAPHGLTIGVVLVQTLERERRVVPEQLERVADALGVPADGTADGSRAVRGVRDLLEGMRFPVLRSIGVDESHVDALTDLAVGDPFLTLSPEPWTTEEVRGAFLAALAEEPQATDVDAIVVGAGFSGLYMLHRLRELGLSAVVLERGRGVGGTWYWNRYPGARCDIESIDYCYSFSTELLEEWEWTERYADAAGDPALPRARRRPLRPAPRHPLRDHASPRPPGTRRSSWTVETDAGDTLTARYLVMAAGNLSAVKRPDFAGPGGLRGRLVPHRRAGRTRASTSRGKRVAVIGTGSSGIQAIPRIAAQAEHLVRVPAHAQLLDAGA